MKVSTSTSHVRGVFKESPGGPNNKVIRPGLITPLMSCKMVKGRLFDGKTRHDANISSNMSRVKLSREGNALSPTYTSASTDKCSNRTSTVGTSMPTRSMRSLMCNRSCSVSCSLLARALSRRFWRMPCSSNNFSMAAHWIVSLASTGEVAGESFQILEAPWPCANQLPSYVEGDAIAV